MPLPLMWEHLVGTSAVFSGTLENTHASVFGFGSRHFWQN